MALPISSRHRFYQAALATSLSDIAKVGIDIPVFSLKEHFRFGKPLKKIRYEYRYLGICHLNSEIDDKNILGTLGRSESKQTCH
jgi:hypothetical protein